MEDHLKKTVISAFFLTAFLLPGFASAFCFDYAGRYYGISPELLSAIALVESSHDPHAVNRNRNGSIDYGLMQVNSQWAPEFGEYWDYIKDPCYNVLAGAWILRRCITRFDDTWGAVGCYNTGRADGRSVTRYIRKVKEALAINYKD
ncbi:MAG: lytic transglycosylase domain-containing protein [Deltaproteobacteria bacterium]|nr:lytic transglycosylase domain-containing protein [Deltaproteobacteria bacterium]